ncbi:class I SAM-dependent methyltransferase [Phocicoccus pinnipedialis]|uniref:Ribosomal RNA small subunit methyltransferase J n=1 Tax=Phocicoccus pinnipedialis TaxID=110845 RepID=A0A6V7R503_9BACL|nr:class I SAM-dependent methyltransferase [Jeotgalicoccus pinnipedialis]MBP1939778.1 hypothetical protein [Jeotgalicoccus pinnipedialis]CAD2072406.1 Ribosomal RNA small subunit methyltransferase J [Jeotgalicoccus pinnipedialis]
MIITTSGRSNVSVIHEAKRIAERYNASYIHRNKESIKKLLEKYQTNILMVGREKIELHTHSGKVKYHPNFAQVRAKRLLKGQSDAFIEATELNKGSSIIDCTMGMLSDSLIASFIVDEAGSVTSLEAVQDLYITMVEGMDRYRYEIQELSKAASRIKTYNINAIDYLKSQEDSSVDVVYFDPMFEETVESSSGIQSIESLANHNGLTEEFINEAKRVANKRVVLKAHFRSSMFETFGFMRCVRSSSASHFGVIII